MPDAAPILDLIEAFRRSKTMFTAVHLGVFDQLASGAGSATEIAAALLLNQQACSRLLDGCVALQLLSKTGNLYRNTSAAEQFLVSSSPDTLAHYIVYSDQSLYPLWSKLADAIREGSNRWEQVFGSRNALFDHYFRDPAATRAFLGGMHGFGQLASERMVSAFDLSPFHHLVDLGGATGHLAIAACRRYPKLRATVLDLPLVTPYARETISTAQLADRIYVLDGDFFKDQLPPADLYYLGRILHDWSDEQLAPLLQKIFASLPVNGALLIGETLVNPDRSGPVYSLMQDLNMLVCTDGHERTATEYQALLTQLGFAQIECRNTGSLIDAILALKSKSTEANEQNSDRAD